MHMSFKDALIHAQQRSERSIRSIAIAADVPYDTLKNVVQGKSQRPNLEDALKVARSFGVSLEQFLDGELDQGAKRIAVAGRVGAGAEIELVDAYPKGDGLYHVACPSELSCRGLVAVEVAGDSMAPIYEPGTILFYARDALAVPTEALGRICVAATTDNHVWLKQVKPGTSPGLFHLLSINPAGLNMHDARLAWASPVKLSLPPDLVKRI